MAHLFIINDKAVFPNPETLLISPFKDIWDRDRSPGKENAIQEFAYIEFMTSMLKSNPYREYPEAKKDEIIRKDIITQIDCWNGKSGSSKVWIEYKGKTDKIPVSVTLCDKLKIGETIQLYYDEDFDYFFKKGYVNIGWLIVAFVLLIISFTGKQINKLNAFLKNQH